MAGVGTTAAERTARPRSLLGRRGRSILFQVIILLLILPGALLFLSPFIWMISTSLKEMKDVFLFPPQLIPDPFVFDNYRAALTKLPFHIFAANTVQVTVLALAGQLLTASMVAFGFARLRFPGRDVLFIVLLSTIMLPGQVTLIPQFILFRFLGWYDTLLPLIVPFWAGGGAFSVFLLRQFMGTISTELDDAAKIDGCSFFDIYWRITLPLVKPALAAVAIFGFLYHWNDFYHPVIYLSTQSNWTLALGVNALRRMNFSGWGFDVDMNLIMAASVVVLLPPLLIFFFAQKYFIQGVVFTGVKG